MRGWLSIRGSTLAFAINQSVGVLHLSPLHYTATAHKYSDFQYSGLLYCFGTQVFRLSVFGVIILLQNTSIQTFSIQVYYTATAYKYSAFQYSGLLYCYSTQVFSQTFSIIILLRYTIIQTFSIQGYYISSHLIKIWLELFLDLFVF